MPLGGLTSRPGAVCRACAEGGNHADHRIFHHLLVSRERLTSSGVVDDSQACRVSTGRVAAPRSSSELAPLLVTRNGVTLT